MVVVGGGGFGPALQRGPAAVVAEKAPQKILGGSLRFLKGSAAISVISIPEPSIQEPETRTVSER